MRGNPEAGKLSHGGERGVSSGGGRRTEIRNLGASSRGAPGKAATASYQDSTTNKGTPLEWSRGRVKTPEGETEGPYFKGAPPNGAQKVPKGERGATLTKYSNNGS